MSSSVLVDVAERLAPAIVGIRGRGAGTGSGVVVAPGMIVTLARNVPEEEVLVRLQDGREFKARVHGRDASVDLALLALPADVELPAAGWAADGQLPIGTEVFAFGNPGGRGLRATAGVVASAPRAIRGPSGRLIEGTIEHTAPLPSGSGGGPLVDGEGRIVGINALRHDRGFLLAWPASALRERVAELSAGRETAPRTLGVALVSPRQARRLRRAVGLTPVPGLLIRAVQDGSLAEQTGLHRGDVLVSVDGEPLTDIDELYAAVDRARLQTVHLGVVRGEETLSFDVAFEDPA